MLMFVKEVFQSSFQKLECVQTDWEKKLLNIKKAYVYRSEKEPKFWESPKDRSFFFCRNINNEPENILSSVW